MQKRVPSNWWIRSSLEWIKKAVKKFAYSEAEEPFKYFHVMGDVMGCTDGIRVHLSDNALELDDGVYKVLQDIVDGSELIVEQVESKNIFTEKAVKQFYPDSKPDAIIRIDANLLKEALEMETDSTVWIEIRGELSPIVVLSDDKTHRAVIMPCRHEPPQ